MNAVAEMTAPSLVVNEKLIIPYRRFTFFVIGAGGTGSYLIRDLARIISINNEKFNRQDDMVVIDADVVEPKNLSRQNFIMSDVGKNKAEVLSERYKNAFGVDISYIPEYITTENAKEIITASGGSRNHCNVVIGCVDNNKTRHILQDLYGNSNYRHFVWIDSGNEEFGGQVVFAARTAMNKFGREIHFTRSYDKMKSVVEEFELDNNDKHPNEVSCAEHAVSAPQNIATNIMAANILFGYCNSMLAGASNFFNSADKNAFISDEANGSTADQRMNRFMDRAPMISSHISYFNSRTGQISTRPFSDATQEILKSYR